MQAGELAFPAQLIFHIDQFNNKNKRRVRWYRAAATWPIGDSGRNHKDRLVADMHPAYTLVPTFDDASFAEQKLERRATVTRTVKFRAVGQRSRVMDDDRLPDLWLDACAFLGNEISAPTAF